MLMPFLYILAWCAWDFFWAAWVQEEGSGSSTGIENRWFIKFFIFVGPVLFLLLGLSKLLGLYVRIFGPPEIHTETLINSANHASHSSFNWLFQSISNSFGYGTGRICLTTPLKWMGVPFATNW